jgi:hypothetical protein
MAALFDPWPDQADRAIAHLARMGRTFTAEDVRELAGDPDRPNAMGVRLLAAAKAGRIRQIGVERSSRPERHAGLVIVWQGVRPDGP